MSRQRLMLINEEKLLIEVVGETNNDSNERDSLDNDVSNVSTDAETESAVTTTQTNSLSFLDEDDHNRRISS